MAKAIEEKASLLSRAGEAIKEGWDNLHIGRGHFTAWVREGFKELTHQLLPAFPAGHHVIEEPGLWGNPTQGEVAKGRQDSGVTPMSSAAVEVAALNEEPVRSQPARPDVSPVAPPAPSQDAPGKDIVEQAKSAGQEPPEQDRGRDQSIERER